MLCQTRWTVKAHSFKSIIKNFKFLIKTFEQNVEESRTSMKPDMKARINGIISVMTTFSHYYAFNLAYQILRHTDNLATAIQNPRLNVTQGYNLAMATVQVLEDESTEEKFQLFYSDVLKSAKGQLISE